ncbi:MAG: helix-turn-helix transcriptional regulator [Desulfitobacterium hafniense]|nr:helix-turn-helix transcriptional regulator [Desulfitobacterium hafniense]
MSGYERNYRTPDLEMTTKIADVFGVTVDYLVGREESESMPWWEKANPPARIELEEFIRSQPNLRLFGDPMNEDVKDDLMLALQTAWEVVKKTKK